MSLKVLGIGDNVADHYLDSNILYPGGNALNFAAYAKMLGADSAYLGVFGDDFPGRHVYETARAMGIGLERCRILHGENGCPKVRVVDGTKISEYVLSDREKEEYALLKVLGMGDNVCDIYLNKKTMYPGGQALNVAVFAKRLGAHAEYLGVFGSDAMARHVRNTLDELQVPYVRCREVDDENGYAKVNLVDGDRVFMGSNRSGPIHKYPIILDEQDLDYVAGFDLVHTSNNSFLDTELPKLEALPPILSYDFSYHWNDEGRIERVCPYIDFGFLSCGSGLRDQAEYICRQLHQKGCGVVVATMGRNGAMLFDGINLLYQPSDPTPAIDPMGAGDSFAACMLVSALEEIRACGLNLWSDETDVRKEVFQGALKKASSFATDVCMAPGAFNHGIPLPDDIWNTVFNRKEENAP
jgi:sugar/nucleoside kinase (ribokinase family)